MRYSQAHLISCFLNHPLALDGLDTAWAEAENIVVPIPDGPWHTTWGTS